MLLPLPAKDLLGPLVGTGPGGSVTTTGGLVAGGFVAGGLVGAAVRGAGAAVVASWTGEKNQNKTKRKPHKNVIILQNAISQYNIRT